MNGKSEEKLTNPDLPIHHAIAEWAAVCAERVLPIFEELRPGDDRPRAAIAALHSWKRGDVPTAACRAASLEANAAANDANEEGKPAAVAAARAAGQAVAAAHAFDHAPQAATYAAKAVGLHRGEAARTSERSWQWENLAPELRSIGFPEGL